mmetsp:Transcript_1044/g.6611  ORF Transcript_1044/g.6611 Transcript_1044/m.6611 type:complete len:215 (-) Transcript_1044:134-778(-)
MSSSNLSDLPKMMTSFAFCFGLFFISPSTSTVEVSIFFSTAYPWFFKISATVTTEEMAIPKAESSTSSCACRNFCGAKPRHRSMQASSVRQASPMDRWNIKKKPHARRAMRSSTRSIHPGFTSDHAYPHGHVSTVLRVHRPSFDPPSIRSSFMHIESTDLLSRWRQTCARLLQVVAQDHAVVGSVRSTFAVSYSTGSTFRLRSDLDARTFERFT